MASEFERRAMPGAAVGQAAAVDEGLRSYMLRVYNYMTTGLALTGIIAYLVANTPPLLNAIYGTGLGFVVALAPLGIIFFISFRIHKMSFAGAQMAFWAFAAAMGLGLAYIFIVYTGASVARVFFISAATFAGMSLWGYATKRDLSGFGNFLIMGVFGILIAMLVNIFLGSAMIDFLVSVLGSAMIDFLVSVLGVLIFVGLTAYDTQRIKETYYAADGDEVAGKKAIMGALRLYLDFINMFVFLLHLFGVARE